jgi:hypothetical protein
MFNPVLKSLLETLAALIPAANMFNEGSLKSLTTQVQGIVVDSLLYNMLSVSLLEKVVEFRPGG